MRRALAFLPLVLVLAAPRARPDAPESLRVVRDAIEISSDTRLAPGAWLVTERDGKGVLRVTTSGVTLDLDGATLRGAAPDADRSTLAGVGILVEGASDVTIRGGAVSGFRVGIRAVNAPGLRVRSVDASGNFRQRLGSTPEREDPADWLWPHHNDAGEWEARYGAGISLSDCERAEVSGCRVRRGQNGLLLTRCTRCAAYDNDFSFNSGWGIALYRTTHSEISHNRCDFCVRGYSHGAYHRGQDSAGILVFEQCTHNLFVRNSATHSGDGFFLYAGHETTERTGRGGSNHNRVYENDFRFAVANGIEATFSEGNDFAKNDCSGGDHGIWAGYSRRSQFRYNRIQDCLTAGISIEHGHHNTILQNDVRGARYGVHLWWDEDPQFLDGPYGRAQDCSSSHNTISFNRIHGTTAALRLWNDQDSVVTFDAFGPGPTTVALGPGTRLASFEGNAFGGDLTVVNRTGAALELAGTNGIAGELGAEGDAVTILPPQAPLPTVPPPPPAVPEVSGALDVSYPDAMPRGRAEMRIDEWGPVDPRETRLFPARQAAAGPVAEVHLLGRRPYRVAETGGGVVVEPRQGTAPATLTVRAEAGGPALRPFRLVVASGGERHEAAGTLLRMPWEVAWFAWSESEDPMARPEAFAALLAGEPLVRRRLDGLDLAWRGGGPEGVPADRFATRATSTVELPAGRYRLRVVSDDGVRLFVDGEKVVERWDRHGPTEDVAEVVLAPGRHVFRIDHFEIDGWAHLSFRLEEVPR